VSGNPANQPPFSLPSLRPTSSQRTSRYPTATQSSSRVDPRWPPTSPPPIVCGRWSLRTAPHPILVPTRAPSLVMAAIWPRYMQRTTMRRRATPQRRWRYPAAWHTNRASVALYGDGHDGGTPAGAVGGGGGQMGIFLEGAGIHGIHSAKRKGGHAEYGIARRSLSVGGIRSSRPPETGSATLTFGPIKMRKWHRARKTKNAHDTHVEFCESTKNNAV